MPRNVFSFVASPAPRAPSTTPARLRVSLCARASPQSPPPRNTLPKVLTLGEALLDCLFPATLSQPGTPSSSDAHRPKLTELQCLPGGAPANVATALAKLGTPTAFLGAVGDDPAGDIIAEVLTHAGVRSDGLVRTQEAPTRRVLVACDEGSGERQFVGFAASASDTGTGDTASVAAGYADEMLKVEEVDAALFGHDAEFLVMGTLALAGARPVAEAAVAAARLAVVMDMSVMVDINWRPVFWADCGVDPDDAREPVLDFVSTWATFVKISDEDCAWLFPDLTLEHVLADPRVVRVRLGPRVRGVLVTAGARGAAYAIGEYRGCVGVADEVLRGGVVDTTGAGDAFVAGFISEVVARGGILALESEDECRAVVEFAAVCGGLTVCREGAMDAQPTRAEVEQVMSTTRAL